MNFAEEEDLEYIIFERQGNVTVYDWGRLSGETYIIAYNEQGVDNICITKKIDETVNFEETEENEGQELQYICETKNDSVLNDIPCPRGIEIVDREGDNITYLYILHKLSHEGEKCHGAKITKLGYNKTDGSLNIERVTEIEGMSDEGDFVYSLTVDPDEELGFITETTEEKEDLISASQISNMYFVDMNKEKYKAKVLSNGLSDLDLQDPKNEVPIIYGVALTQKYSVISFSPANTGTLYLFDKYYAVHSDENGLFRGKSLIEYSEERDSGVTGSKAYCGNAVGFTSDQNDNIYFMHTLRSEAGTQSIKLWKGASCVTLKELNYSNADQVSINNKIHIADERIMYLVNENSHVQIRGLYIGANSYTSVKEHYDSVVDEPVFMGAVFGTYFGALVIGLVVICVRLFLAKRNR